ncbi:M4 family metallopeptidase [Streptomyces tricolor]|nr:M4 family metallopeptidase [Streptomyces tricolor]
MDDPDSALLGETLRRTKDPARLRDPRPERRAHHRRFSFLGVRFSTDNGGVHLNSTIFAGALSGTSAKPSAPTSPTRSSTRPCTGTSPPLDGFTQGRAAVVAAAKQLRDRRAELAAVQRAFTAHGIVPNWEKALGIDSDVLLSRVNTYDTHLGAGWRLVGRRQFERVRLRAVLGVGQPHRRQGDSCRARARNARPLPRQPGHRRQGTGGGRPTAPPAWTSWPGPCGADRCAPCGTAGAPVRHWADGDVVAFAYSNHGGRAGVAHLEPEGPDARRDHRRRHLPPGDLPSVHNGKIVYQDRRRVRAVYESTTRLIDVATGEETVIQQAAPQTSLGPDGPHRRPRLLAALTPSARNGTTTCAAPDSTARASPTSARRPAPDARNVSEVTASADAVTMVARTPAAETGNATLSKLWQFTPDRKGDGLRRSRVSCNRGEQLSPPPRPTAPASSGWTRPPASATW